jgi:hypothetical protein
MVPSKNILSAPSIPFTRANITVYFLKQYRVIHRLTNLEKTLILQKILYFLLSPFLANILFGDLEKYSNIHHLFYARKTIPSYHQKNILAPPPATYFTQNKKY